MTDSVLSSQEIRAAATARTELSRQYSDAMPASGAVLARAELG